MIEMPVKDDNEATIVTKFFDYDASEEDRANALVHYNKRYYQSTGIDIASEDGEEFDVIASLSGTVSEVKEDPLLGNVVVLDHDNEVHTYYASLGEVSVKEGDEVKQGDALGTAGKNLFGKDNGVHVHFELRKDGKEVNPELFFNQPVSKLASLETEEVIENDSDDETEANVDADEEGLEEDTDEDDEEKLDDNEDKVDEEDKTDDEEDADETNEEDTE
ncbi:M23 family metallopeptidase [Paracerasibacillus soli]|uniref:M23 family metallopeptidase n=2 Tax=Paracerasibacillus soli TaxID=480284 RepID=A0ABU5CSW7_9BACI|nr:M23 family metallopeptidase [Virgibacillus soli]MDY0409473.1 M23 family metallopeptidase [Virgibacillus soli]